MKSKTIYEVFFGILIEEYYHVSCVLGEKSESGDACCI